MNLEELISELEKEPHNKIVKYGFSNPHSYRGYYHELAFEPTENVRVSDMLKNAKECLGKTFEGWKGGEFKMNEFTTVYLSYKGTTGEELSLYGLAFILGRNKPVGD